MANVIAKVPKKCKRILPAPEVLCVKRKSTVTENETQRHQNARTQGHQGVNSPLRIGLASLRLGVNEKGAMSWKAPELTACASFNLSVPPPASPGQTDPFA